uniref:Uncharacterized protein n=1 Tax=Candidatus Kentrum sp. FM TaxID=2126340 RepID=A0A450VWL1_9GAMM|nr:MAG: hypothetical protein BECKFM1743C_GA0114222_101069 [Candidatus Kentron sp. FM]VFK09135.1 MAG: hypothetical protein BECKFM1743B_GA0114221_100969 [Candidatus Kentron sp. FM]
MRGKLRLPAGSFYHRLPEEVGASRKKGDASLFGREIATQKGSVPFPPMNSS